MVEIVWVVSREPLEFFFLIIVNSRLFGICPRTELPIDKDLGPVEKVKVLSSTLVRIYLARPPPATEMLWAIR